MSERKDTSLGEAHDVVLGAAAALPRAVSGRRPLEAPARSRDYIAPALAVRGAEDRLSPIEHGRRLAETTPHARFGLIAGGRGLIPDHPRVRAERVHR